MVLSRCSNRGCSSHSLRGSTNSFRHQRGARPTGRDQISGGRRCARPSATCWHRMPTWRTSVWCSNGPPRPRQRGDGRRRRQWPGGCGGKVIPIASPRGWLRKDDRRDESGCRAGEARTEGDGDRRSRSAVRRCSDRLAAHSRTWSGRGSLGGTPGRDGAQDLPDAPPFGPVRVVRSRLPSAGGHDHRRRRRHAIGLLADEFRS